MHSMQPNNSIANILISDDLVIFSLNHLHLPLTSPFTVLLPNSMPPLQSLCMLSALSHHRHSL